MPSTILTSKIAVWADEEFFFVLSLRTFCGTLEALKGTVEIAVSVCGKVDSVSPYLLLL